MEITATVPGGLTVRIEGAAVHIKGAKGELSRTFVHPLVSLKLENGAFKITSKDEKRATLAIVGTWRAHLKNMFTGVTNGYERRMKIVHVHFPMSVKVEGGRLVVQNLLGQKNPKYAQIESGVDAEVDGDVITIRGISKESVGQTVSNIETATKLANRRDRRRFYDGIYAMS